MKKKIIIFSIILIILLGGIGAYILINRNNSNKSENEIIEEVIEQLNIEGEMMAIQMTEKTSDYVQFMALFTEEDSNISIEEVVKDYMSK